MRHKTLILLIAGLLIFSAFFMGCGKDGDHPAEEQAADAHDHGDGEHSHEGEDAAADSHDHLHIAPELIKQWGIQYVSPEPRDYVEKVVLTGVAKQNKKTTFIINTPVGGIVTGIKRDIGDTVKKGDTLCVLNSPELLEMKTNYIKAFQEYRLTKENYERTKKLFDIKAIEKKGLISRETEYKTAMAEYFSLEAALGTIGFAKSTLQAIRDAVTTDDSEKLKGFLSPFYYIPSPGSGKVMARDLTLGARVENNSTIFEISDTRRIWVLLDAMEKDLQYIEKQKNVSIVSDIYPDEYFEGRVLTLMEKIDPELRTVKVRVEVKNDNGRLKPEMYVRGMLEKKVKQRNLAIPVTSLVKVSGVDGVFVIETDGFLFRPVQVLATDSVGYAFIKGLIEEDLVVTEGSFYLKAEYEIQRGATDAHAGHSH